MYFTRGDLMLALDSACLLAAGDSKKEPGYGSRKKASAKKL